MPSLQHSISQSHDHAVTHAQNIADAVSYKRDKITASKKTFRGYLKDLEDTTPTKTTVTSSEKSFFIVVPYPQNSKFTFRHIFDPSLARAFRSTYSGYVSPPFLSKTFTRCIKQSCGYI